MRPISGGHDMHHHPRKRFGQNFLIDESVIEAITREIHPIQTDHLVEIGAGKGALTASLIASGCRLDAIELDRDLTTHLLAHFSIFPKFKLHSADALRFDFDSLSADDRSLRIVGNLPYNISTPLIFRLLDQAPLIEDMHFMLQKEVVDRLAARPGNKNWGRLGVMAQFVCEVEALLDVPPSAFYPSPKVTSALVRLRPHRNPFSERVDQELLSRLVTTAFAQRRKTLRNNVKGLLSDAQLEASDVDPAARAETVTLEQFMRLINDHAEALAKVNLKSPREVAGTF